VARNIQIVQCLCLFTNYHGTSASPDHNLMNSSCVNVNTRPYSINLLLIVLLVRIPQCHGPLGDQMSREGAMRVRWVVGVPIQRSD
jgi:hypothetical protein